jgi:hypothetical protein
LSDLAGYSWKKLDELVEKGVALERMNNLDFVSADQYARMGGWEGMNWTILSESRDGEKVRQRLRRWRLLVPVYRVTLRVKSRLSRGISKIRAVNRDAK